MILEVSAVFLYIFTSEDDVASFQMGVKYTCTTLYVKM